MRTAPRRSTCGSPPATPRPAARVADLYPSLAAAYGELTFETFDADRCDGLDLVFLGLPHGASQDVVPELTGRVGRVVDLAADFRLRDASLYPTWYGEEHTHPELLDDLRRTGCPSCSATTSPAPTRVAAPGLLRHDRGRWRWPRCCGRA